MDVRGCVGCVPRPCERAGMDVVGRVGVYRAM